jgi:hypothetical protein
MRSIGPLFGPHFGAIEKPMLRVLSIALGVITFEQVACPSCPHIELCAWLPTLVFVTSLRVPEILCGPRK